MTLFARRTAKPDDEEDAVERFATAVIDLERAGWDRVDLHLLAYDAIESGDDDDV